jgi:hypothetical protein
MYLTHVLDLLAGYGDPNRLAVAIGRARLAGGA